MTYILKPSTRKDKKWMIITPENKKIHFGQEGYSDYTIHKNDIRKKSYIARHQKRENWTKSGINTPGFFARWILWNLPSLMNSISDTERRFGINIVRRS